jgi:Trk-type K+ transport system membrane component
MVVMLFGRLEILSVLILFSLIIKEINLAPGKGAGSCK